MVRGPGLNARIGHGKGFEDSINLSMIVELPEVAVMGMNNPLCIISPLQSIQGSKFSFNRKAFIHRGHPFCLPFEIFIQTEALDIFLCFSESQADPSAEADIFRTGPFLDDIPGHLKHFCIRRPPQEGEAMMGGEDIDRVSVVDLSKIHSSQGFFRCLSNCLYPLITWEERRGNTGKQIPD